MHTNHALEQRQCREVDRETSLLCSSAAGFKVSADEECGAMRQADDPVINPIVGL